MAVKIDKDTSGLLITGGGSDLSIELLVSSEGVDGEAYLHLPLHGILAAALAVKYKQPDECAKLLEWFSSFMEAEDATYVSGDTPIQ